MNLLTYSSSKMRRNVSALTFFILFITSCFASNDSILVVSNKSFDGAYAPAAETFIADDISNLSCDRVELTYIGVEVDSNSQSGELILGFYEEGVLIYSTSSLSVNGGANELIGESVPLGIVMQPGANYAIGLIKSTGGDLYFKTTTDPVHLGSNTFNSSHSMEIDNITFPVLPSPISSTGALPFNVGFHVEGVTTSDNTEATIDVVSCLEYTSPSGNYAWGASGQYFDTIPNASGCDSLLTLNVTITQPITEIADMDACESYKWPTTGQTYVNSGVYTHVSQNMNGCDTTFVLNLTIHYPSTETIEVTECGSFYWPDNGATYTTSGVYTAQLIGAGGCDSLVTLNLSILDAPINTVTEVACDAYFWDLTQTTYTTSGLYDTVFTAANGCDSTVVLDLTINTSVIISESVTACDSFTWPLTGESYTSTGAYTATLDNMNGCDTIVMLHLNINHSVQSTDIVSSCAGSYTWINGETYTSANNTATMTYQTVQGCDSTVTLNLSFFDVNYPTETVVACDSYTWSNGVTYTESTFGPQMSFTTSTGCDYIVTLDLTILESTTSVDEVTSCGPYTWIDGVTYLTSNNTATHTIPNANGCDSIITLNLTIESIDPTVSASNYILISNQPGANYQWYSNANGLQIIPGATSQVYVATTDGVYAVQVSNGNCDALSPNMIVNTANLETISANSLEVFPNPSNGQFEVQFDGNLEAVEVLDMTGRKMNVSVDLTTGKVNANTLSSGKYMVRISTEDQPSVIKEIVIY